MPCDEFCATEEYLRTKEKVKSSERPRPGHCKSVRSYHREHDFSLKILGLSCVNVLITCVAKKWSINRNQAHFLQAGCFEDPEAIMKTRTCCFAASETSAPPDPHFPVVFENQCLFTSHTLSPH